jgi:hypothetical protein
MIFCDETKSHVETLEIMACQFSEKRATMRWPLAVFFGIVYIDTIIAYVLCTALFSSSKKYRASWRFLIDLPKETLNVKQEDVWRTLTREEKPSGTKLLQVDSNIIWQGWRKIQKERLQSDRGVYPAKGKKTKQMNDGCRSMYDEHMKKKILCSHCVD